MKQLLALSLLLLLVSFASSAPAPAEVDVPLPQGLPPRLTTAKMTPSGELVLMELVPVHVTFKVARTIFVDGKKMIREELATKVGYNSVERSMKPTGLEGYDTKGKKLTAAALAKALSKRTVVAVSPNGLPVDPVYLTALKAGTVVLVFPASPSPAPRVLAPRPGLDRKAD